MLMIFFIHLRSVLDTRSFRQSLGDLERDLLALPTQMGGMGIINHIRMCGFEFSASNKVTKPLQSLLLSQTGTFQVMSNFPP